LAYTNTLTSKPTGRNERMKASLLSLLLLPLCTYFALIAFAPRVLAWRCLGIPLSLLLAFGLIWLGFLVTLLYVRQTNRQSEGKP